MNFVAFDWWLRNNFSRRASVILRLLNFYITGPPRGSICSQTFFKIGALKNLANFTEKQNWQNFAKFTGKQLYQCLSFNKVACNFIKKETLTQVFFCAKFLRTPFFYGTPLVDAPIMTQKIIFHLEYQLCCAYLVFA